MANKTGTISPGDPIAPQPKVEDEKDVLVDSFLVRFRPRDDWRGEYGFDWVREGKKDYEERIGTGNQDYTIKKMKQFLLNNEKWINSKRESLLDAHQSYNKILYGNDFPRKDPFESEPELWDVVFDALAEEEAEENIRDKEYVIANYDADSFKEGDGESDFDEQQEDMAGKDTPIEYFYAPEHVIKAVYKIDRDVSDVWTCEVYYENMANGDAAAVNTQTVELDHFIYFSTNERTSLKKEGDSYQAFIYEEKHISSSSFNANTSYKIVQFEEKNVKYDLLYRIVDGAVYLLATLVITSVGQLGNVNTEPGKKYKYKLNLINGSLQSVKIFEKPKESENPWLRPNQVPSKDLNRIYSCITHNIVANMDMTIDALSRSKEKKDIVITIVHPGSIRKITLGAEDGYKEKEDRNDVEKHDQWYGKDIISWQEDYEDSFPQRNVPKKIEQEVLVDGKSYYGVNKRGMYLVPVLSFGCDSILHNRTWFKFGGVYDAPIKEAEKNNEYEIQFRVQGKCKTLRLKSNRSDVVLDQTEFENPKDKTKLKVTFTGSEPCTAEIVGTAEFDDGSTCYAGSLVVVARRTQFMYISLVMVKLDNAEFPQKMKDVMQDNVDALRNALSSAGIVPDIRELSINVKTSEIRQFKEGTKWNYEKKVQGKEIDDVFVKKYADLCKTNPMLQYRNVVFLFPAFFYDNCAAYAFSKLLPKSQDKLSYVVESKSFACYRSDCYQIVHELLHRLHHPHNFQLFHVQDENDVQKKVQTTPYCFPIAKTSNIMDYWKLLYSLHQFQWELMEKSLLVCNRLYYKMLRKYNPNILARYREHLAKLEEYNNRRFGDKS